MKHRNLLTLTILFAAATSAMGQNLLEESINKGKRIYKANCVSCHMANGEGMTGAFPPLAKSDYLMEDKERSIKLILEGANGEMKVNNKTYYGNMLGYNMLKDQQVADVLNYIRNSWGNKGEVIQAKEVGKVRE